MTEVKDQPGIKESNDDQSEKIKIGDQEFTPEEAAELISKGKDYTKKTQDLAEEKKQFEAKQKEQPSNSDDSEPTEEDKTKEWLKNNKFAQSDDIENALKAYDIRKSKEQELNGILQANPDLVKFKSAIEKLSLAENKTFEEIIIENGFKDEARFEKVTGRNIKGEIEYNSKNIVTKGSDLKNMSREDFKKEFMEKKD